MAKIHLTAALAREFFSYDADTGLMHWRIKPCVRVDAGDRAGTLNSDGYLQVGFKFKVYTVHRVAWLYATGEWPVGQVDHINGVRTDNRMANLRDVSASLNQHNRRRVARNNSSGFTGVSWVQNAWRAAIWVDGRHVFLGYFKAPEEAHAAYLEAKRRLHAGCTV